MTRFWPNSEKTTNELNNKIGLNDIFLGIIILQSLENPANGLGIILDSLELWGFFPHHLSFSLFALQLYFEAQLLQSSTLFSSTVDLLHLSRVSRAAGMVYA